MCLLPSVIRRVSSRHESSGAKSQRAFSIVQQNIFPQNSFVHCHSKYHSTGSFTWQKVGVFSKQFLNNNYFYCSFIYRDIKPENFVLGLLGTESAKTIHLVDFGMAKMYIDKKTQKHIRARSNKPMLGTACYMSCNAHFSYELSRRDDLEALGYMFLYFLKGTVPWAASLQSNLSESTPMKQLQKIGSMKQALSPDDLFEDCPQEFAKYLK